MELVICKGLMLSYSARYTLGQYSTLLHRDILSPFVLNVYAYIGLQTRQHNKVARENFFGAPF